MTAKRYNEDFKLNPKDISLIEEGLRALLHDLSHQAMELAGAAGGQEQNLGAIKVIDDKEKTINQLLGKLHDKKVFYGQVHRQEGVPLG